MKKFMTCFAFLLICIISINATVDTPTDGNSIQKEEITHADIDQLIKDHPFLKESYLNVVTSNAGITPLSKHWLYLSVGQSAFVQGCCGNWMDDGNGGVKRLCCYETSQGGNCHYQHASCPYCLDVPADPCLAG